MTAGPYRDYGDLTRGAHTLGADVNKGIWAYRQVTGPDGKARRPAVLLLSNNLGREHEMNPWLDVIDSDNGYALYHGDNRTPGRQPFESRGNALLLSLFPTFNEPDKRSLAPPVLMFEQAETEGRRKGFRRFAGYGVPRTFRLQTQASRAGHFPNLVIELVLLGLEAEAELFDWAWIDSRRDGSLSATQSNLLAPAAWAHWVAEGDAALERRRRRVLRRRIISTATQRDLTREESSILREVYLFYEANRHGFEGLASLIARRVIGDGCQRGWVTKRSGDGGIDFVSRMDVGSGESTTSAVVLGQAKCVAPRSVIGGKDLARVIARLRRGWIGAFVTTGVFSEAAQAELHEDEYPLILINGKRLVSEIRQELQVAKLTLPELLARESAWYDANMSGSNPIGILRDIHQGLVVGARLA